MRKQMIIIAMALSLLFTGCQSFSEKDTEAEKQPEVYSEVQVNQTQNYQNEFSSTNGLITFQFDVNDLSAEIPPLPLIQVTPKSITPDTAKRVASVLFDNAAMYEYSTALTKDELEDLINELRSLLTDSALQESYGNDPGLLDYGRQIRQAMLQDYESRYASGAYNVDREMCRWTFYPVNHYTGVIGVDTASEEYISYNKTNCIQATTTIEDIPYQLIVWSRNEADYRIQTIDAFILRERYPDNQYEKLLYDLCRNSPGNEQVERIKEKAEDMIRRMEIGEWRIETCEIREVPVNVTAGESLTTYQVQVCAAPLYNGVPVIRQNQLMNLKTGDENASNYYYEDLIFTFTPDGNLIEFSYKSPLQVVNTLNESAAAISLNEMLELMQAHLESTEAADYNPNEAVGIPAYQAGKICVHIDEIEIGLSRTRMPNNPNDFYLLPAATLRGSCEVYNTEGTLIYDSSDPFFSEWGSSFLVMNLIDGSVIDVAKGY